MAILNGDSISGALGRGVFYYRKGKKIIRAKPEHYTDRKSPAQLYNRAKMTMTSRFIRSVQSFIRIGYQDTQEELYDNYSNEARQLIMKNCFTRVDDHPVLLYEQIKISRGEIRSPEEYSMKITGIPAGSGEGVQAIATISWKIPDHSEWMLNPLDKVMLCMFSDSGKDGISWLNKNMAERKDGTLSITIPKSDMPIHFWIFFNNSDAYEGESKKKVSDSVYLGEFINQE